MTRRRTVLWVVVVIGVGLVVYGLYPVYLDHRYAVNEAGVGQVAVGMSAAEVEELLGRRGDHHRKVQRKLTEGETVIVAGKAFVGPAELNVSFVDWWSPRQDDYVRVGFDDNDRVFATERLPAPDIWLRLRGWLSGF